MDTKANRELLLKKEYYSIYEQVLLERNVDGIPSVWLLYRPEQDQFKDSNVYMWIRRCEVFTSIGDIPEYLVNVVGVSILHYYKHELFNELLVVEDERGFKWYIEKAGVHVKTVRDRAFDKVET